jgi:uncharacterized protein (DUF1499 family)
MSTTLTILLGLPLAVALMIMIVGRERSLAMVFGPADQGAVNLAALDRRGRPNDAFLAPADFNAGTRRPDAAAPVFDHPAEAVREALAAIALAEPLTGQVAQDAVMLHDRYVQRTPLMRFPDTIDVKVIELGEARSTLAIYSRAQIGYRDFGVNRARIDRWLAKAAQALDSPR